MAGLDKIVFDRGGKESLGRVKPLWEKLNRHHLAQSTFFKHHFSTFTFEKRQDRLINDKNLRLMVDLAVDMQTGLDVGYVLVSLSPEGIGEIESLFLEKEYRKLGLGEVLMNRAVHWLTEQNSKTIQISVAEGNEAVLPFYRRFGFYPRKILLEFVPPEHRPSADQ